MTTNETEKEMNTKTLEQQITETNQLPDPEEADYVAYATRNRELGFEVMERWPWLMERMRDVY